MDETLQLKIFSRVTSTPPSVQCSTPLFPKVGSSHYCRNDTKSVNLVLVNTVFIVFDFLFSHFYEQSLEKTFEYRLSVLPLLKKLICKFMSFLLCFFRGFKLYFHYMSPIKLK